MSSQHKAPFAAFLVVAVLCLVVVIQAARTDAVTKLFDPLRSMQRIAGISFLPLTVGGDGDSASDDAGRETSASAGAHVLTADAVATSAAGQVEAAAGPVRHHGHGPKLHGANDLTTTEVGNPAIAQPASQPDSAPAVPAAASQQDDVQGDDQGADQGNSQGNDQGKVHGNGQGQGHATSASAHSASADHGSFRDGRAYGHDRSGRQHGSGHGSWGHHRSTSVPSSYSSVRSRWTGSPYVPGGQDGHGRWQDDRSDRDHQRGGHGSHGDRGRH